jgi:septum site-determining protein MinC
MIEQLKLKENIPCFQFKANFLPCTILQITRDNLDKLENDLLFAISSAPHFFKGCSVIIDMEKVQANGFVNFVKIKQILIENGMIPLGLRGGSSEQQEAASQAGLPILPVSKAQSEPHKNKKNESTTKIITTPIRGGMQVYAKEGDLIVLAAVSPGAELFADGNIHVYGPLRGRALAGVQGNTQARIFCRALEAELVSIAGYYLTRDDMQSLPSQNETVQIFLENAQIRISTINER